MAPKMRIRVRVNGVEGGATLSGGRSKHILKLTGPGCAKLVHAQGTAQALWASLQQ